MDFRAKTRAYEVFFSDISESPPSTIRAPPTSSVVGVEGAAF